MTKDQNPKRPRPVVLCILDGWGYRKPAPDNAVSQARAPTLNRLMTDYPHAFLEASEAWVGLPAGQIGNSEVGHMNIGAGRVVMQELPRINQAMEIGEFPSNPALAKLIGKLKASRGTCHLVGLVSDGGVHSHQDHMVGLARALSEAGVPVAIHVLTDGRDVLPKSALQCVGKFAADIANIENVRIGTVGGRYYAMDRDNRWDRVELAYRTLVSAEGPKSSDALAVIREAYDGGKTDEFILPHVVGDYAGMKDGDGLLVANFRADRVRQICAALLDPNFSGFARGKVVKFAGAVGIAEYSKDLSTRMDIMFPPQSLDKGLGEIVAKAGLRQLRAAETEKYPHVTFFFNGGREAPYEGEDRILVPSPKVATYDLKPEMSAPELTDKVKTAIDGGAYDLIVMNYANLDMVGHSGILAAAIKAVEAIDACVGRLIESVERQGGAMIVTADHGNCEVMADKKGGPHTAHTPNPVPVVLVGGPRGVKMRDGKLADIAPTIVELMGLKRPAEMTGHSLLVTGAGAGSRTPVMVGQA